jgi:ABC-2 type transport system permease protein
VSGAVLRKTLRDQVRPLVWWSLGVLAVVLLMSLLWTSIRDVYTEELMSAYPEELQEAFNLEGAMSGAGYLNIEVFSIILPVLFIVFGVGRGARLIAGEEQEGVLEPVLATPVPRWGILLQKAAGLAVGVLVLTVATALATMLGSAVGDLAIPWADAAVGAAAMGLLGLYAGWLALAVGAATGHRGAAMAVAGLVLVGGYLLHIVGAILEGVEPWRVVSPFTQAIDEGPIGDVVPWGFAVLALTAAAFIALAVPLFERRDVETG